jgi:hypothetical protein
LLHVPERFAELLLAAKLCEHLLKPRVIPQRIPNWIKPELVNGDAGRRLQRSIQQSESSIDVAATR